MRALAYLVVGCALGGCSDANRSGEGSLGGDAGTASLASIRGTVWAPGNAPGMVSPGEEIPIFDALVRLTPDRPEPIPQEVYCGRCANVFGAHTRTGHQGRFNLGSMEPGDYWLVIEKGQFRLETQITLAADEVRELPPSQTTLPSRHNPEEGTFTPKIAVATGNYDSLEDVLGKMDLGTVDVNGSYSPGPGSEGIDFYANGGGDFPGMRGSLESLVSNASLMAQYHIIFIPCASDSNASALRQGNVLRNLRDYVHAGGKLYVTDWSGEWHDNVFPAHVELGVREDTPAEAYDRDTDTWNTNLFGDADGSFYDSLNAEAVDEDLHTWLHGQYGPTLEAGVETYDASHFAVEGNWNVIEGIHTVEVGVDEEGLPVVDTPKVWVIGGSYDSTPKKPLTVTYEPTGCGRVLYSTYHTTDNRHQGLVPQERILLYLIMEIGICKMGPVLI